MGANKGLFEMMRLDEVAFMDDFTKFEATKTGKRMVDNIIEKGNINPHELAVNLFRLNEVIASAATTLRDKLPHEKYEYKGMTFTPVNGGETINYSDDEVWAEIKAQLTAREMLLKLAYKSGIEFYDTNGVEVPRVSTTPRKSSITIKF